MILYTVSIVQHTRISQSTHNSDIHSKVTPHKNEQNNSPSWTYHRMSGNQISIYIKWNSRWMITYFYIMKGGEWRLSWWPRWHGVTTFKGITIWEDFTNHLDRWLGITSKWPGFVIITLFIAAIFLLTVVGQSVTFCF